MEDFFRLAKFWPYIDNKVTKLDDSNTDKKKKWDETHEHIYTLLKNRCEKNPRSKIKKDTDAAVAWKSLKEYLPQGSRILNSLFQKLFGLTLASCNDNPTTYTDQFKDTLEQIENFSEKMKPEDNLLIFQFHRGLIPQYSSYFELYNQTHNACKDDGTRTTKYTLDYTITRFLNTMSNPTSSVNYESS